MSDTVQMPALFELERLRVVSITGAKWITKGTEALSSVAQGISPAYLQNASVPFFCDALEISEQTEA
jgi:hypothetical protein